MDGSAEAHPTERQHVARGTEVFVGGLAPSLTEDKVREVFASCGEISEVRMITNNKGITKGYCFVRFLTREAAVKAMKEKNGQMVEGRKMGVLPSTYQTVLFFGNLPKDWSAAYFETEVRQKFEDVTSVELAISQSDGQTSSGQKLVNRGFGFVRFSSRAAAARALKIGSKADFFLVGSLHPTVQWAEEEPEVDPEEFSKVKVAFVRNLPKAVTQDFLEKLFQPFGNIEKVVLSKKTGGQVAFVHFAERSELDEAIRQLNEKTIQGHDSGQPFKLQVEVARPFEKKKKRAHDDPSWPGHKPTSQLKKKSRPDFPSSYAHMPRAFQEPPAIADPYEEIVVSLSAPVKDRLLRILRLGLATRYDIDIHSLRSLKELPESSSISILNQYMLSAADEVDKGAFLDRLISKYHASRLGTSGVPLRISREFVGDLESVRPDYPRVPARDSYTTYAGAPIPWGNTTIVQDPGFPGGNKHHQRYAPSIPSSDYASPAQVGIPPAEKASRSPAPLASYGASGLNSPFQPRRAHQPSFDPSPASYGAPRLNSPLQTASAQPPSRTQVRFDPYTGEPYKFDPYTGEPIAPDPVQHHGGSLY